MSYTRWNSIYHPLDHSQRDVRHVCDPAFSHVFVTSVRREGGGAEVGSKFLPLTFNTSFQFVFHKSAAVCTCRTLMKRYPQNLEKDANIDCRLFRTASTVTLYIKLHCTRNNTTLDIKRVFIHDNNLSSNYTIAHHSLHLIHFTEYKMHQTQYISGSIFIPLPNSTIHHYNYYQTYDLRMLTCSFCIIIANLEYILNCFATLFPNRHSQM